MSTYDPREDDDACAELAEYLGHWPSDRDLDEMDPYRRAGDWEEVSSL